MSDKPLTDITFSSFELHPSLLAGLDAAGFTRCTPIQALTLPITLPGRDVAGQAQTGTGKTLAFLVTVVNRSEEHTSELQSLMRISYAVFCLKKKRQTKHH